MKLLSQKQIESLSKFRSDHYLTTSFYLDTDKSRLRKKEILLTAKNILRRGKTRLDSMDLSKEKKESLLQDMEKIKKFCSQIIPSQNFAGLAIFSCSHQDFWQDYDLPAPPRNRIVFDKDPYVRFLSSILNEFRHICVLTLDRREAKWYDVIMGEISLMESMVGDVPGRVKEGGWEGYESKRIERRIDTLLREYFKKTAQKTFSLFKKNHFDWLFVGCIDEYFAEFEPLLHPYLKQRFKGQLKANPGDSPDSILKETTALEKKVKKKEEDDLVNRFVSELEKGGRASSGLKNSLQRLNRGEVQTLLVSRNFSHPGRICPHCQFLYVDELRCPSCQKKTDPVVDIVDEAVEKALDKNSQVRHINPSSKLNRYGKIGSYLRYKA
ncbi:MAG: hypothetical protein ACLFVG_05395 [Candidatus Aminicenantes bacterium]